MTVDKKEMVEVVRRMMAAPSCCAEARAAGQRWLDALGKADEAAKARSLIAELEADLVPIDGLIAFMGSEEGAALFGAEKAKEFEAHGREIKAKGAKYCDCGACSAALEVLDHREVLLK